MEIDWLTTAAQFINFFVLVWLLRRFLYRPVTEAIEARRAATAKAFEDAETMQAKAEAERAALAAERATLAAARQSQLTAAEAEADAYRQTLRDEALAQERTARQEFSASLTAERDAFGHALKAEAGQTAIALARRVLDDLADEALEALLLRRLGRELATEDIRQRANEEEPLAATLTCRWRHEELEAEMSERLGQDLSRMLGRPVRLDIRQAEAAPVGAVLEAPGLRAAWTIDGHLDRVLERLSTQPRAGDAQ